MQIDEKKNKFQMREGPQKTSHFQFLQLDIRLRKEALGTFYIKVFFFKCFTEKKAFWREWERVPRRPLRVNELFSTISLLLLLFGSFMNSVSSTTTDGEEKHIPKEM